MSNQRTIWSNPFLIQLTGDPSHILRDYKSYRTVYQRKGLRKFDGTVQELIHRLSQTFDTLDRKTTPQSPAPGLQLTSAALNMETESDQRVSEQLLRMITQETRRK